MVQSSERQTTRLPTPVLVSRTRRRNSHPAGQRSGEPPFARGRIPDLEGTTVMVRSLCVGGRLSRRLSLSRLQVLKKFRLVLCASLADAAGAMHRVCGGTAVSCGTCAMLLASAARHAPQAAARLLKSTKLTLSRRYAYRFFPASRAALSGIQLRRVPSPECRTVQCSACGVCHCW